MASGADQGFIGVALTKWNNTTMIRDTVAYAYNALAGMAMSWANFTIPMMYMSGDDPDSCIIVLSASRANNVAAAANSYLYVDELAFSGLVAGVSESLPLIGVSISPNPASDFLVIDLSNVNDENAIVTVFDVQGKMVKAVESAELNSKTTINIADIPKGNYILKISSGSKIISKSFIKQ
jgi:hypothetical protein